MTAVKQKVFVLDTNVPLLDPTAIDSLDGPGNTVVIPQTVLEELDKQKTRPEIGYQAREATRQILSLITNKGGEIGKSISLKKGGHLILDNGSLTQKNFCNLDSSIADNRILACGHKHKRSKGSKVRTVIISNDNMMRIKASSTKIASEEFEAINYKDGIDDLYSAPRVIEVNPHDLTMFMSGKEDVLKFNDDVRFARELVMISNGNTLVPGQIVDGALSAFKYKNGKFSIDARNPEQALGLCGLDQERNIMTSLVGPAGTGKTILALAMAIQKRQREKNHKILVFRSTDQAGDELGFLPGTLTEKMAPYRKALAGAYHAIRAHGKESDLPEDFDAYCHESGKMELEPPNFARGSTYNNTTIILEEAQNFSPHQIKTLTTRVGEGTNIILTGDPDQIDNRFLTKRSCGLTHVLSKTKTNSLFQHLNMFEGERSELATAASQLL